MLAKPVKVIRKHGNKATQSEPHNSHATKTPVDIFKNALKDAKCSICKDKYKTRLENVEKWSK